MGQDLPPCHGCGKPNSGRFGLQENGKIYPHCFQCYTEE